MDFSAQIRAAAEMIRRAQFAVALTGAGLSTASGIPDFRTPGSGLWSQVDPMEVASLPAFRRDPAAFYSWIKPLARTMMTAQPNAAHRALARLERHGWLSLTITQNIDLLHERAGSVHVLEIHGGIREATCIQCYQVQPAAELLERWLEHDEMPRCQRCGHAMKPNVILFGEQLPAQVFTKARLAARQCDLMLVAGSSLEVYPASELPQLALAGGAQVVVVNREPTFLDDRAAIVIEADVAEALPKLADEVIHDAF